LHDFNQGAEEQSAYGSQKTNADSKKQKGQILAGKARMQGAEGGLEMFDYWGEKAQSFIAAWLRYDPDLCCVHSGHPTCRPLICQHEDRRM
jgi:hypothetical protein